MSPRVDVEEFSKVRLWPKRKNPVQRVEDRYARRAADTKNYDTHEYTKKGIFADRTVKYTTPKNPQSRRARAQAFFQPSAQKVDVRWKRGRVAAAVGAGGLAAGVLGHQMYQSNKKGVAPQPVQISGQPVRVQNVDKAVRPRSVEDKEDLPGLKYRDRRYDGIEARGMLFPKPGALGGYASEVIAGEPVSAVVGGGTDALKRGSSRGSRGHVVAQTGEGGGPGGVGRFFGVRRRSMVKPGAARAGEEDLPFKVVRRPEKDRKKERRERTVQPAVTGGLAAGAAYSLTNPKVQQGLKRVGDEAVKRFGSGTKAAEVAGKAPGPAKSAAKNVTQRGVEAAKLVYRNPKTAAAVAAGLGAAGAVHGNKRKPDTHEIKFIHPRSKGKAKEKSPKK